MSMVGQRMQAAYDQIAAQYAEKNAAMPQALSAAGCRLLQLLGPGPRILDAGCGAGRDMAWLERHGATVVGVDVSRRMLALARSVTHGPLLQMDMCSLGLRAGSFAGVWCCASLLHLPKREAPLALAELRRALLPQGVVFLSMQEGTGEGWEQGPYPQVQRFFARYSHEELATLLIQSGFRVIESSATESGRCRWLQFFAVAMGSETRPVSAA
jgi:ubiquinone/menaquinone biosynthesis C-methylase UbiE